MMLLTGSLLNALGIILGGIAGLALTRQFSPPTQSALRGLIGMATVLLGLWITWLSINGTAAQSFKQVVILILALTLGRFLGRLLRIQQSLNRLGQFANDRLTKTKPEDPNRASDGFTVCALLFCAGPLGPIGAVQAGLASHWEPLAVKAVMDGLAAMGFVGIFGWGVMLSALPVFVFQGTITLAVFQLAPMLDRLHLVDSINMVAGMLIFCVALIVLELKKFELADYLPSLAMAPLITWLWR